MKNLNTMTTNQLIDYGFTEYGLELLDFDFTFKDNGEIKNRNKKQIAIARIEAIQDTLKDDDIVIRVGEKNNFNQTEKEFQELEKYKNKGKIFVNSNAFTKISAKYPSIVTINPYMKFVPLKGDLSNVKAVRVKVFLSDSTIFVNEQIKCFNFCEEHNLPILLTFMRYRSKKTVLKYTGVDFQSLGYKWEKNYYRPCQETKDLLKIIAVHHSNEKLVHTCDSSGNGCPACMNCTKLTYGTKNATIKALNLSISGIKDKNGKQGLCPYHCPDCFAKIVTFGKRPQCDKLITNNKITGKLKN